jgi:hypothetical protein
MANGTFTFEVFNGISSLRVMSPFDYTPLARTRVLNTMGQLGHHNEEKNSNRGEHRTKPNVFGSRDVCQLSGANFGTKIIEISMIFYFGYLLPASRSIHNYTNQYFVFLAHKEPQNVHI